MNSIREDPDNNNGVTAINWDYGWKKGNNIVDTELLGDILISGTYSEEEEGDTIIVQIEISNPGFSSKDVTVELLDNGASFAEKTESLGPFESIDLWKLKCNSHYRGGCSHMFNEGHTMSVGMSADGMVNVDYMDGYAHLEFYTNQMSTEEFFAYDVQGNDMMGMEFFPRLPEETGGSIAHFRGHFMNAMTIRDVHHMEIQVETPDGETIALDHPSLVEDPSRLIHFDLNWSFEDYIQDEDDAGTYYVNITIIDQNENEFEYPEALRFVISKYGTYVKLADSETDSKHIYPGNSTSFSLEVLHAGLVPRDTFELVHSEPPGHWNVTVEPDVLDLEDGGWKGVVVAVQVPGDAGIGESLELRITSGSSGSGEDDEYNTAEWTIRLTVVVAARADISLFYREGDSEDDDSEFIDPHTKQGTIMKGEQHDFFFRLRNDSPVPDTISLDVSGIPADWMARIIDPGGNQSSEGIFLGGNEEKLLVCRVQTPMSLGASNSANLEIRGTSQNNESVQDNIFLNISRHSGVVLSLMDPEETRELIPGEQNYLALFVENHAIEDAVFILDVEYEILKFQGWSVSSDTAELSLGPGESKEVMIIILPLLDALYQRHSYSFDVIVEEKNDNSIRYSLPIYLEVKKQIGFEMTLYPRERSEMLPDQSIEHRFSPAF